MMIFIKEMKLKSQTNIEQQTHFQEVQLANATSKAHKRNARLKRSLHP